MPRHAVGGRGTVRHLRPRRLHRRRAARRPLAARRAALARPRGVGGDALGAAAALRDGGARLPAGGRRRPAVDGRGGRGAGRGGRGRARAGARGRRVRAAAVPAPRDPGRADRGPRARHRARIAAAYDAPRRPVLNDRWRRRLRPRWGPAACAVAVAGAAGARLGGVDAAWLGAVQLVPPSCCWSASRRRSTSRCRGSRRRTTAGPARRSPSRCSTSCAREPPRSLAPTLLLVRRRACGCAAPRTEGIALELGGSATAGAARWSAGHPQLRRPRRARAAEALRLPRAARHARAATPDRGRRWPRARPRARRRRRARRRSAQPHPPRRDLRDRPCGAVTATRRFAGRTPRSRRASAALTRSRIRCRPHGRSAAGGGRA